MNVARKQKSRVAATVFTAVAAHQVIHFDVRFKNRGGLSSPTTILRFEPYYLLKFTLLIRFYQLS
jgi:hypothetical protein